MYIYVERGLGLYKEKACPLGGTCQGGVLVDSINQCPLCAGHERTGAEGSTC